MADREADVYLYLAKRTSQPAVTIAQGLKMHKAQVYRLVRNLQTKGFLEATLETPARFAVIPFDELLEFHVRTKQEELNYLQGYRRSNLLSQWQTILASDLQVPSETYVVFEGRERFYAKWIQMERAAQKKSDAIITVTATVRAERYGHLERIRQIVSQSQNVNRRTIVEVTANNLEATKHALSIFKGLPQYVVRHHFVETQRFPRFGLKDDEEVLLRLSSFYPGTDKPGSGLWSNSGALVNVFRVLFNELWRNAVDIDERIWELEKATA